MNPKTYAQGLQFSMDVFQRRADVRNLPEGSLFRRMYDEISVELASVTAESDRNVSYMDALSHKDPGMDGGAGA